MLLRTAIQAFDLGAYALRHGAEPGRREEWILTCPMCGKEKLCINVDRQTWHCWVCEQYAVGMDGRRRPIAGAGGVLDLVQLLEGVSREQAIDMVLSGSMFAHVDCAVLPEGEVHDEMMRSYRASPEIAGPESWNPCTGILPWMQKRGILLEDASAFGLGWCSAGRYRGRMIFPVWEEGRFVYFQARAMWDPKPGETHIKALNPPSMRGAAVSSEVVMNLDQARLYPRVAIVEGPVDAVKTGPDAVATFGKQLHAVQVAKLRRAGVRAVDLMWDGPSATEPRGAWDEMLAAVPLLSTLFDVRLVFLPQGDPGDYTRDQLHWFRYHGQSARGASFVQTL